MDELKIYGEMGGGLDAVGLPDLDLGGEYSARVLQEFMTLKSSSDLTDRIRAFREFGPETLGKENWIIGLVGMMYDKVTPVGLTREIMVRSLELISEDPLFLSVSVLKVLKAQLKDMKPISSAIREKLISPQFLAHLKRHRSERMGKELQNLTVRVLEELGFSRECDDLLKKIGVDPLARVRSKSSYRPPSVASLENVKVEKSRSMALDRVYARQVEESSPLVLLSSLEMTLHLFNQRSFEFTGLNPALLLGAVSLAARDGVRTISLDNILPSQVAIVTDFPVHNTFDSPNVGILKLDPLHRIKVFTDYFEQVLLKKFEYVIVVFPHSKMWSSYFFAQQAAESLGVVSRVKLIDSGVFGLGFQHFFDRVVAYFEEGNPVVSLDSQCAGWAQKISSFVALEDTRIIQQSPLFDSLKFKQKSGVLSCSVPLSVLSSSDEFGDCVSSLVMHISEKLAASFDHTIQVVYHGCEAEVLQARDSLLTFFPSANVIVIKANPILVSYFGVFFGVSFVDM